MFILGELGYLAKSFVKTIFVVYVPFLLLMGLIHYPYATDPSIVRGSVHARSNKAEKRRDADFYTVAYQGKPNEKRGLDYETTARAAAERDDVPGKIRNFVKEYNLHDKKVLEVGSGRGYLQDMVEDYTGLDLSESVRKLYHKPFVAGSATAMPFPDNTFDAIWTVWVMEHIPEPERAFNEMRRVLKPGGVIFLYVAYLCDPWLAEGFAVRPYSDFNWRGKVVKASIPIRESTWFRLSHMAPVRLMRTAEYAISGPSQPLRFRALEANYDVYWLPDSDAAISLDSYETFLWFRSRGDKCLNCKDALEEGLRVRNPMVIRVSE